MSGAAVIALFGPTGVGKTEVAIALADGLRELGERPLAISADALQVYEGLEILTGAATAQQRTRLEHRLVGFVPLHETFSAGRYAQLAHAEIDTALAAGRRPIVVGGTGLYLRAALTELELRPPPDPQLRERWSRRLRKRGPLQLHAELARRAPWAAEAIAPTDRQRIIRALELDEMGELRNRAGDNELWTASTRVPTLLAGLVMAREALYRRIDARVQEMVAAGAREEVRAAAATASPTARAALGFEELLAGDIEQMQRRTRNYARRQLTWMRKLPGVAVIDVTDREPAEVGRELLERWRAAS
ncbi:MAG TPA: tRNA (adenosine(37)-N6)-dimethylallyltransferase MiaA [Solirubrobacteraceae bacterium]|nr:tRNA (adenosine(37)-N6)-dimethylallyltransferase MiaA [Solirubrobacteraceae bacterium]